MHRIFKAIYRGKTKKISRDIFYKDYVKHVIFMGCLQLDMGQIFIN